MTVQLTSAEAQLMRAVLTFAAPQLTLPDLEVGAWLMEKLNFAERADLAALGPAIVLGRL